MLDRAQHVCTAAGLLMQMLAPVLETDGRKFILSIAEVAEDEAHRLSRAATAQCGNDEDRLTSHANHVRSMVRHMSELKLFVPAVRDGTASKAVMLAALQSAAYLKGQLQAMEMGIV